MTNDASVAEFKPSPLDSLGDTAPLYLVCAVLSVFRLHTGAAFACFVLGTTLWLYRWTTTFVNVDAQGLVEGKVAGNRFNARVADITDVQVGRTLWMRHAMLIFADGKKIDIPPSIAKNESFRRHIPALASKTGSGEPMDPPAGTRN